MGTGKYLKEKWPDIKIIAIEPAESPVMSGGEPGLHGIQGIGDGSKFLVDLDFVDEVHTIKTSTSESASKHLAKKYGLFVGVSAGANLYSSFDWLRKNNCKNAITIICDRGEGTLAVCNMSKVGLVFPHQLFEEIVFSNDVKEIFVIEHPLFFYSSISFIRLN